MSDASSKSGFKLWHKIVLGIVAVLAVGGAGLFGFGVWYLETRDARELSKLAFREHCAGCHGIDLKGGEGGPALVGGALSVGDDHEALVAAISRQGQGAHDYLTGDARDQFSPELLKALALYVSERRQDFVTTEASYQFIPQDGQGVETQYHDFTIERVTDLPSRPYGLAALPDGRLLVAEKTRGLSLIDKQGRQSEVLSGTPRVWDTILSVQGAWLNLGIMLDVALHPQYDENGWIYISHTDRCWLDCASPVPVTMVRVLRGRIKDGAWVDQQVIWSVHHDHYTPVPDGVASGRLAFDRVGHIYISVGGKNTYDKLHQLNTPFGKIHRVRDDGTVPEDNPYFQAASVRGDASTRHTVWSIGHRTAQGLAEHPDSGAIWNAEMGPRGGDEVNYIMRGGNYGWPLYTNGLDYDGDRVTIGEDLGLDFALEDTVLPVVDFTPAPALSNLTFHHGAAFKNWNGDMLVGSLKAGTLYRVRANKDGAIEQEKLLTNFGRIRDIAVGRDGVVYVALEHGEAGSVWRLAPL